MYFRSPKDGLVADLEGRWAFQRFVDAFINSPSICRLLPGVVAFPGSSFMKLLDDEAQPVRDAGRFEQRADMSAPEDAWESFLLSLTTATTGWLAFLKVHLRGDVPEHFQHRVPRWEETLAPTALTVLEKSSRLSIRQDGRLTRFLEAVGDVQDVDVAFTDEARRLGASVPQYGVAIAFNIYQRRAAYIRNCARAGVAGSIYPLRAGALSSHASEVEGPLEGADEIRWGRIMASLLSEGIIPRDESRFCDLLREVRMSVKASDGFESNIMRARAAAGRERDALLCDAVLSVFLDSRVVPPFRSTVLRERLMASLQRLAQSDKIFGVVAYEIISLATRSRLLNEIEIRFRIAWSHRHLWKVYRIPGLDDSNGAL
jgi:hypothetical protein